MTYTYYTYNSDTDNRVYRTRRDPDTERVTVLKKAEGARRYRQQAIDALRNMLKPGDTVYVVQRKVSTSGMSRQLQLLQSDNGIHDITNTAAIALDWPTSDAGYIKVTGCGMDMHFHTVYSLGYVLWPNGTPEPHGSRNGQPDNDGGYALKHVTL